MSSKYYYPTAGVAIQYFTRNGVPASGWYLKFYRGATSDPLPMAFNSSGTDVEGQEYLVDKVLLNDDGIPQSGPRGQGSTGTVVPHVNQAYRFLLYPSAEAADNNDFTVAIANIERIVPAALDVITQLQATNTTELTHTFGGDAVPINLWRLLNSVAVTAESFGADPSGLSESTAFVAAALANSNLVIFTSGTYLIDTIRPPRDYINVVFIGDVTLKAVSNGSILFHQTTSNCKHDGQFKVDSNGKSGVIGAILGPYDLTDTSTVSHQFNNKMPSIIPDSGCNEGMIVQCGPDVLGVNSTVRSNQICSIVPKNNRRSLWFKSAANAGADIPRSNKVMGVFVEPGSSINTILQVDAGSENVFYDISGDGVNSGSSPNSTPTCIKIADNCAVTSLANDNNKFFGGAIYGTRPVDNSNSTTKTYGLTYDAASSVLGGITSV